MPLMTMKRDVTVDLNVGSTCSKMDVISDEECCRMRVVVLKGIVELAASSELNISSLTELLRRTTTCATRSTRSFEILWDLDLLTGSGDDKGNVEEGVHYDKTKARVKQRKEPIRVKRKNKEVHHGERKNTRGKVRSLVGL